MPVLPFASYRGIDLVTATSGSVVDEFVPAADDAARGTNQDRAAGQSWTSGADPQEVTGFRFRFDRTGIVDGMLVRAAVYAHSGTYGTSSVWTGDPLVTSPFYAADSALASATDFFFPVSGWTPDPSTNYVAVVQAFGFFPDNSNRLDFIQDTAGDATHDGNLSALVDASGNLTAFSTDLGFAVYESGGGETPGQAGDLSALSRAAKQHGVLASMILRGVRTILFFLIGAQ